MVRSVAEDVATAVVWPAITFKSAPVRVASSSPTTTGNTNASSSAAPSGFSESDDWADAEPVSSPSPPSSSDDDSGPPPEAMEAQMRAELAGREGRPAAKPRATSRADDEQEKPTAELPPLGALVARLPDDVRATLDELFRLRFQAVRQVPRKALVPPTGKPSA